MAGKLPFRWSDDYGARVGVMPHGGRNNDVRWYEIAPCYVAHVFNAYEDESGGIVVDVVRFADILRESSDWREAPVDPSALHRWRIDLAAGRVSEQQLDDRLIEFPRVDDRRMGRPYRYGYVVCAPRGGYAATGSAIVKYDLRSGSAEVHDFGEGCIPSEPVFVPASANAAEGEGWLMTYVYDTARNASDFVIFDARDIGATPVAIVALPQRVPFGLHGNWFPDLVS
jgi:carotenoid cleavage dioxygenase